MYYLFNYFLNFGNERKRAHKHDIIRAERTCTSLNLTIITSGGDTATVYKPITVGRG